MKIAVYDDNQIDIDNLKSCIHSFFQKNNIEYELEICSTTNQLLKNINYYDILFLDIEIRNENGIDIGLQLRNKHINTTIIITSKYQKYLIDGYKIQADRYFIKPINQDYFNMEMTNIMERYFRQQKYFIDEKISNTKIYFNDILYIETFDRKSIIHLKSGIVLNTPYILKYWIDLLDNNMFGQPHKSFIVNYAHIEKINNQDIIIHKKNIPLSRHFKETFENRYYESLHRIL